MGHRICFISVFVMVSVLNVCSEGKPQTSVDEFLEGLGNVTSENIPNDQSWPDIIHKPTGTGTPCGSYEAVRISALSDNIGNSPKLLKEMGAMASLHSSSVDLSSRTQVCGGVLISDRWVITAAHCFTNDEISITTISLGRFDLDKDYYRSEDTYEIEECYLHPDYSHSTRYNDLALLSTDRPVQYKPTIFPFCLPNQNVMLDQNTFLQVAGYGHVNTTSKSPELKSIFVNLVENENCQQIFAYAAPGKIEEAYPDGLNSKVLCAGRPGVNACQGDSGGPLSHIDVDGGRTLDGLVSRGTDKCPKLHLTPVIYTNVISYIDWIYYKTGIHGPEINECENDNGGCMHICTDTPRSFACSCAIGFALGTDKSSCYDKFRGPYDKVWSDEQCPVIEGTGNDESLLGCKARCDKLPECTAFVYSDGFYNHCEGDSLSDLGLSCLLNIPSLNCILYNCSFPIPDPALDSPAYKGYELRTGECSERCMEQLYAAAATGDHSYITTELSNVNNSGLLVKGQDKDDRNRTALHIAAEFGHFLVARALLEAGANPNSKDSYGNTPVHAAAYKGRTTILRMLLQHEYQVDVNQQGEAGRTPVLEAAQGGQTDAMNVLLARGADVNIVDNDGDSPLMEATGWGHVEAARILIAAGAEVGYARPSDGQTALHWAAYVLFPSLDVVRLLLENNANKMQQDNNGDTPADLARREVAATWNTIDQRELYNEIAEFIDNWQ